MKSYEQKLKSQICTLWYKSCKMTNLAAMSARIYIWKSELDLYYIMIGIPGYICSLREIKQSFSPFCPTTFSFGLEMVVSLYVVLKSYTTGSVLRRDPWQCSSGWTMVVTVWLSAKQLHYYVSRITELILNN